MPAGHAEVQEVLHHREDQLHRDVLRRREEGARLQGQQVSCGLLLRMRELLRPEAQALISRSSSGSSTAIPPCLVHQLMHAAVVRETPHLQPTANSSRHSRRLQEEQGR